ncbi:unnamed protein product [Staurois parvus]|uniref:Ribosomal protein L32 n=1 Tax=Staurois parvus TaxID=386267 RepID=A0ABN9A9M5_9NEOB|nr:unnamed protein product [Staurois parvus]
MLQKRSKSLQNSILGLFLSRKKKFFFSLLKKKKNANAKKNVAKHR